MGIAGFYLWLQQLYPTCIEDIPQGLVDDAINETVRRKDSVTLLSSGSSASGKRKKKKARVEVTETTHDIFYVDMNGLIHPCCHDTHPLPEPETEEEMLERCFDQLDLLVRVVRPKKCLVLCIDGVAPRSKMNQQRSRRFRAAEERLESDAIAAECADEIVRRYHLPRPRVRERWDSNVITPATAFMERAGNALEWFVTKKLNEDPLWAHLTVTFSSARVPGEGEHKIMQYIRGLRQSPGYDPRTTHVIHGMDADLICLGLAMHEPNILILRNQLTETYQPDPGRFTYFSLKQFRECLKQDFANIQNMDFERVLDDYVFLCFFVGNDFLPHVPLISIKAKGLELLLDHYVRYFTNHQYLTKNGEIRFDRVQKFLQSFVRHCTGALKKQYRLIERAKERAKINVRDRVEESEMEIETLVDTLETLKEEAKAEEAALREGRPLTEKTVSGGKNSCVSDSSTSEISQLIFALLTSIRKERARLVADTQPLTFSYVESDYREAYYYSKFGWPEADKSSDSADPDGLQRLINNCCAEYFRGMQWIMRYYIHGCPSWDWYYPFHYAPLVDDLAAFSGQVNVVMELGAPLHPVQQLLAVLPRLSVHALPEKLHKAVQDPGSILAHFYPDAIDVDFSEANFSYQGVLRIPFLDCKALQEACGALIQLDGVVENSLVMGRAGNHFFQKMSSILKEHVKNCTNAGKHSGAPSSLLVPIPFHVTSVVPIAGKCGLPDKPIPFENPLVCPDEGLIAANCFHSTPIQSNVVSSFTYALIPDVIFGTSGRKQRKKSARHEKRLLPPTLPPPPYTVPLPPDYQNPPHHTVERQSFIEVPNQLDFFSQETASYSANCNSFHYSQAPPVTLHGGGTGAVPQSTEQSCEGPPLPYFSPPLPPPFVNQLKVPPLPAYPAPEGTLYHEQPFHEGYSLPTQAETQGFGSAPIRNRKRRR